MSLLDVINASQSAQQVKSASGPSSEFDEQREVFYRAGWNNALNEIKVAAETAANGGTPPEKEETEEERKARRKKEVLSEIKSDPKKAEEYKNKADM